MTVPQHREPCPRRETRGRLSRLVRVCVPLVLLLTLAGCRGGTPDPSQVVLYCALDREFAEGIIADFKQKTGLTVLPHFDTEANKSVGLFEELVREKSAPRCDVHWNNEIVGTIRLQKLGLLEPYDSPAAEPFPPMFRADDHTWHAFAARARILLVNTDRVPAGERPASIRDLADPRWRGQVALAKPQFGTTATHAACLFAVWGRAKAEQYYRALQANDVRLVAGNKQVAEGVGQGRFAFGITDTDDALAEVRAGRPVAIIFPDQQGDNPLGTLFIPNTVALIKGSPHPEGGRRLIDYLLSPEAEKQLALAEGCQIPLNPTVEVELPAALQAGLKARRMQVDFAAAADRWDEAQQVLTEVFAR